MKTCQECRYWVYDNKDKSDIAHNEQGRRHCSLAVGIEAKGMYFHKSMPACRKFSEISNKIQKAA